MHYTKESIQPIEQLYTKLMDTAAASLGTESQFPLDVECIEAVFALREALLASSEHLTLPSSPARTQLSAQLSLQSKWLLQRLNQFNVLSEEDTKQLVALIDAWQQALQEALGASTARECLELLQPHSTAHVRQLVALVTPSVQPVAPIRCEEYSAETQLEVLRFQPPALAEPIVDIGCGRDAALVKLLRGQGTNAVGFDLFESAAEGCLVADWFEFPFMPEQFGTVIAHLSFSLHFLHQHLRPDGEARRYALQYMAILRSLRHGGCFAYAPGLPFIEVLLPSDQYTVKKYGIDRLPMDEHVTKIFTRGLGESPIYACHVGRL